MGKLFVVCDRRYATAEEMSLSMSNLICINHW